MTKAEKHCSDCDTKYTLIWNEDEQDIPPITCPFCGHEIPDDDEEDYEQRYEEDEDWG
jgi:DNA-directed RNA polymerase subunit RPC12/RpoP|tara:strand:+ start:105 stop:278 length:174 start_codon:yes stop_codon:yes gene_type:complete